MAPLEPESKFCHFDLLPDNFVVAPKDNGTYAVTIVDFEYANAGSPLMDLAVLSMGCGLTAEQEVHRRLNDAKEALTNLAALAPKSGDSSQEPLTLAVGDLDGAATDVRRRKWNGPCLFIQIFNVYLTWTFNYLLNELTLSQKGDKLLI